MYRLADGEGHVAVVMFRLAVVPYAGLLLNFRSKRTAQCDVQFLNAAADGQHRNTALDGAADERQAGGVASLIERAVALLRFFSVKGRVHIGGGAGHEQAVHPVENGVNLVSVLEGRDDEGHDTSHFQCGGNILVLRGVPVGPGEMPYVGGYGDNWFWHGGSGTNLRNLCDCRLAKSSTRFAF
ncbi:hypothetical protein D3C78_1112420 [compost metagenome]